MSYGLPAPQGQRIANRFSADPQKGGVSNCTMRTRQPKEGKRTENRRARSTLAALAKPRVLALRLDASTGTRGSGTAKQGRWLASRSTRHRVFSPVRFTDMETLCAAYLPQRRPSASPECSSPSAAATKHNTTGAEAARTDRRRQRHGPA